MRTSSPLTCLIALALSACVQNSAGPAGDDGVSDERADGPGPNISSTLRIRAVGDVMMGSDFPGNGTYLPPNDGADLLAGVVTTLADADVTFANLEGPLCDGGSTSKCGSSTNCYAFRTPTCYGDYLNEAGIDLASIANNHALDFGEFCQRQTIDALEARDIVWSGTIGSIGTLVRDGKKIALVSFHTSTRLNNVNDVSAAATLVQQASSTHNIVVVSFHGGAEGNNAIHVPTGTEYYLGENRGDLRRFAHAVVDAGADIVLGSGPHVPRAIEIYEGRLIAYSLGNFATYGRFSLTGNKGISLILEAELDPTTGAFIAGKAIPVRLEGRGVPVLDEDASVLPLLRRVSREDFSATGVIVTDDGTLLDRASNTDDWTGDAEPSNEDSEAEPCGEGADANECFG